MKHSASRLALGLIAGLFAQIAIAAGPVATVNGVAIPASYADVLLNEQKAQGIPESDQLKAAIRDELIRREALAQAAKAKGVDKQETVRAQLALAQQTTLIRAYLQDWIKANPVTDAELKREYDQLKAEMGEKEYHARHVLLGSEEEAKAVIAKLQAGERFEELAKQSKDPGSKDRGGDLGWANPGMFVKPFSEALVKLEKGKYTTAPVKSDFGWHVIQLDETRPVQLPSLDDLKPQLQQRLQQMKVEKHVAELRDKAKVQ